jgi:hypothetical protein
LYCLLEAAAQGEQSSYAQARALQTFLCFLCVCSQTFQSYMQFKEIPRKLVVAKRLSQCLNPALPTGVHQRALDVYTHILAVLGVLLTELLLFILWDNDFVCFASSSLKVLDGIWRFGRQDCFHSLSMRLHLSKCAVFVFYRKDPS